MAILIDPPSPFATLATWRAFRQEMIDVATETPRHKEHADRYRKMAEEQIAELEREERERPDVAAARASQATPDS